jgi:phosphohistidine phosphatase SixA
MDIRRFTIAAVVCCASASFVPAQAQEMVFLIRHAEKEASGKDPKLTGAGRERAGDWADMLQFGGIDVVFTSDTTRTRETGQIISESLDVPRKEVSREDVAGLMDLPEFDHADEKVLIVGHAETIPSILSGLGVRNTVEVSQDDFANLFIVTAGDEGAPRMIRLIMP